MTHKTEQPMPPVADVGSSGAPRVVAQPASLGSRGDGVGIPVVREAGKTLRIIAVILSLATIVFAGWIVFATVSRMGDTTPRTAAERAILDAKNAIEADPREVTPRINLAKVYIGMGRTEEARRTLRAAAKIDEKNVQVAHLIGLSYLEAEEYDSAIRELKKAAKMKDGYSEQYAAINSDLGKCYAAQGEWKEAVAAYETAVGFSPEAADLVFELGAAYEQAGRSDDAIAAYQGVLRFVPGHSGATDALARIGVKTEGGQQ